VKPARRLSVHAVTAVAIAAGSVGAIMAIANIGSPVRAPLVLSFLLVAPAAAIAGLLDRFDGLARLIIAGTAAIVINFLVAEIMLAAGLWSPRGSVIVVTVITVVCALAQVARVRARLAQVLAPVRSAVSRLSAPARGAAKPAGPAARSAPSTASPAGSDGAGSGAAGSEAAGSDGAGSGAARSSEPDATGTP
jgi:hypothetical protein